MKNKKVAAYLGIALFALAAGCGTAGEKPAVPVSEAADAKDPADTGELADTGDQADTKGAVRTPDDRDEADSGPNTAQEEQKTESLTGTVRSIGEDSMVLSQSFEEEEGVLVAPAEGSPDEVQISVRVSAQTQYEVRTVKNGGVNGDADVEKRSGLFSDLEQDSSVDLVGYYEGEEFVAEKIVIYRFV